MSIPLASRFFTFYSFKGGVGRSMALLNCGYVLAGYGRRVLMIDFDLEAPGLSFLIQRREGKKKSARAGKSKGPATHGFDKGLVELIGEFVQDPEGWPLAQAENANRLEDYLTNLTIPKSVRAPRTKGRLALMPAGRLDDRYESRLANIDWGHEPLASHRDDLFRHLRNLLVSLDAFDYVLIDSRTGWSDEGYISARILADHLIVLTALNDQNIIGTSRFLKQVEGWPQPDNSTKRRVVLVESPVPEWEEQAKADRHEEVQKLFKRETGDAVSFSLALPYNPRIALREEALVADWPDTSLSVAYRQLTAMIQDLAEDTAMYWWERAREAMSSPAMAPEARPATPDLDFVRAALEYLRPVDAKLFSFASDSISDQLIRSTAPIPGDVALMRYLVRFFPDNPSYIRKMAMLLAARRQLDAANREFDKAEEVAERHGNYSERLVVKMQRAKLAQNVDDLTRARGEYTRALTLAREQGDETAIGFALYKLGDLDLSQGKDEKARRGLEEALKVNRSLGHPRGLAATLHSLATLDRLQGEYKNARSRYEESLEIDRALGDQRGIAVTLHSLAELHDLQGEYQQARRGFEESLKIKRTLGDRQQIAVTLHSLAELDHSQGEYQQARRGFEESLMYFHTLGDRRGMGATLHSLAVLELLQGDYEKARCGLKKSLEIKRTVGDQREIAVTVFSLAELDRLEGEYQKARRGFEESLEILRALGARREIAVTPMYQELSAILSGESRSISKLAEHVANTADIGDPYLTARGHLLVAEAMIKLGDRAGAQEELTESIQMSEKHGLNGLKAEAQAQLALLLAETEDRSTAARAAKEAIRFFDAQNVRHPQRETLDRLADAARSAVKRQAK